jgi:agmatinase
MTQLSQQQSGFDLRPSASFFGAEVGDLEDLHAGVVACCGVFCDHYGSSSPGGRFFARQMRYCSSDPWTRNKLGYGVNGIVDVGDLNVYPLEATRLGEVLREQTHRIIETGARIFIANGGFGVTAALVAGIADAIPEKKLHVVRVSRCSDQKPVGANAPLAVPRRQAASRIIEVLEGREDAYTWFPSCRALATDVDLEALGKPIFLSIDADILDPIYGDTGSYRGISGDRPEDVIKLVDRFRGLQVVGAEMTGHLPSFELHGRQETEFSVAICASIVDMLREVPR